MVPFDTLSNGDAAAIFALVTFVFGKVALLVESSEDLVVLIVPILVILQSNLFCLCTYIPCNKSDKDCLVYLHLRAF